MINQDFFNNEFFSYDTNKISVRGFFDNPFEILYKRKEIINRNNNKYKHNFIIKQFKNIFEFDDLTGIENLHKNVGYCINSIINLKKLINSIPETIKFTIDEYKILSHIINIDINNEIVTLNDLSKKLSKNENLTKINREIDNTREGLLLIKESIDNFKKEEEPDHIEISNLKKIYKDIEQSIVKIVDLEFINENLDIAIQNNHKIFEKCRGLGYIMCDADLFAEIIDVETLHYEKQEIINSKYESMYTFKDNSLLFKNKLDGYMEIADNQQFIKIRKEIIIDSIKYELRKNPSLLKAMINLLNRTSTNYNQIFEIIKKYQANNTILKNYNFDIVEYFSTITGDCNFNELEQIDDAIHKIVIQHKVKLFAYSIASKKYHHLYNEETMLLMEHIHDLELDKEVLQNEIGKKLAVYKNSQEFNENLYKFYTYFTDISRNKILEQSKSINARILKDKDNLIIIEIENFNQSELLGSSSWCISRDEKHFKNYTKNNKKQYFIYNFGNKLTDKASLIGITLNNEKIEVAHYKDDTPIKNNDEYLKNCIQFINSQKIED